MFCPYTATRLLTHHRVPGIQIPHMRSGGFEPPHSRVERPLWAVCVCVCVCVHVHGSVWVVHCCHFLGISYILPSPHSEATMKVLSFIVQENARTPVSTKGGSVSLPHCLAQTCVAQINTWRAVHNSLRLLPLTRSCQITPDQHDTANNTMTHKR